MDLFISVLHIILDVIIAIMIIYAIRHYVFTLSRLFGKQRKMYSLINCADWPAITIFTMAHNEENVIADLLTALVKTDYPKHLLEIIPVNDRSTDNTKNIIDEFAKQYPDIIKPFHRIDGKPGKAAALKDATLRAHNPILVIFDADYKPPPKFLQQIVAPFFDPEVGATMGRVVAENANVNLLTRLLDMERSGGYQVNQQARMNLRLVPQYGGTAGAVRRSALDFIDGWNERSLAEDTDLTFRLLLAGWKTVYINTAESYEEAVDNWPARKNQLTRWAKGHNQVFFRYAIPLLFSFRITWRERLDGFLLLLTYFISTVLWFGWIIAVLLYFLGAVPNYYKLLGFLLIISYIGGGNFAPFFEIAAGDYLDGRKKRLLLLPMLIFSFLAGLVIIAKTPFLLIMDKVFRRKLHWSKTHHKGAMG